ncbi:MAG: hypothetical protein U5K75_10425 [Ahrensia sp.]|nr:hypothetical protein [Ahrensia sp.]
MEKFVYPNAVRPVRSGTMAISDQVQFVTLMYFCTFGLPGKHGYHAPLSHFLVLIS